MTDIILTHLHWDHCSPVVEAFGQARLYVQRRELDVIVDPPHPWFTAHAFVDVVQSHLKGCADRLVVLDGDAEVLPGIRVMLLGGHTMGSQAVLVQSDGGPLVLTGDVAITPRNLRDDVPPGYNCDLQACFQGLAHIRRLNAPVITGHDPEYSE